MVVALCPALVAVPAAARDGAKGAAVAPVTTVSIPMNARTISLPEPRVTGAKADPRRALPALPPRDGRASARHYVAALVSNDGGTPVTHALPSIPLPPAEWHVAPERPRKSRIDAAPLDRMSLEGSSDYRRRRNVGLDARLELRIDGREESGMLSLAGRLAGAIRTLERR